MKKLAFYMLMLVMSIGYAYAQGKADIKFEHTQEPVMPGKTGTIKITYNGTGKYPGHFKKSVTLRTNAKTEMMRLFVEGDMTAKDAKYTFL